MERILHRSPLGTPGVRVRNGFDGLVHQLKTNRVLRRGLAIPLGIRRHYIEREKRRVTALLAELNSRIVCGEFKMHIRNLEHDFYVDTRSDNALRLLLEEVYEPQLVSLLKKHIQPDADFIDVGTNVGFISVFAATQLFPERRVLSVEPTPRALQLLRRNIAEHGLEGKIIIAEGVATAKPESEIPIHLIEGKEEYSSLDGIKHPAVHSEKSTTVYVKGYRIDDLVHEHGLAPGLIKIDTEGHEASVLDGAMETLSNHAPVIISEVSDRLLAHSGGSRAIVEKLEGFGYDVRDVCHPDQKPRFPFEGEIIACKN